MHRWPTGRAWVLLLLLSAPSFAVEPREGTGFLDRLALSAPELRAAGRPEPIDSAGAAAAPGVAAGWTSFLQAEAG